MLIKRILNKGNINKLSLKFNKKKQSTLVSHMDLLSTLSR
jgi:hypothetical protein